MRSIPFRFDDLFSFSRLLGAHDQELPVPAGEKVTDGEWVLAIFEIGERRRATASAARGLDKGDGTIWLGFERRDWERLHTFSEAKSEKMKAAAPVPLPPEPEPDDLDADKTQFTPMAPSHVPFRAPPVSAAPPAAPPAASSPPASVPSP